jgi:CMP-N,N'-diacetyllegionaminic acid synthase
MDVLAIIPARGGSKGIPRKNLAPLLGKPLVVHSIEQALASSQISRVVVSTDDGEIGEEAVGHGAEVVWRPDEISGDLASSEAALLHVLDNLRSYDYAPDLVVFLQPTSPYRTVQDIDSTIAMVTTGHWDSAFSGYPEHFVGRWRVLSDESAISINFNIQDRPMRQDVPIEYIENGSIYVVPPSILREDICRFGGRIGVYSMPLLRSFQIDTPEDLELMEAIMSREAVPA